MKAQVKGVRARPTILVEFFAGDDRLTEIGGQSTNLDLSDLREIILSTGSPMTGTSSHYALGSRRQDRAPLHV